MRHRKEGRKLNRSASHRKAMLANMAANLFLHKQIRTTHPKALEARRLAESLITKAKKGDLHSRREVLKVITHKDVVKILFDEIAPQYAERPGGYTRIIKLGQRKNDAAQVSLLALVDWDPSGEFKPSPKKTRTRKATPKAAAKAMAAEATAPVEESAVEEAVTEKVKADEGVAETTAETAGEAKADEDVRDSAPEGGAAADETAEIEHEPDHDGNGKRRPPRDG